MTPRHLFALCVFLCRSIEPAANAAHHFVVVSGQSNATTDVGVGWQWAAEAAGETATVVNVSYSGKPISWWIDSSNQRSSWYLQSLWNPDPLGTPATAQSAYLAQKTANPSLVFHFVWMQGESDTLFGLAPSYVHKLRQLVAYVQADFPEPVHFQIGLIWYSKMETLLSAGQVTACYQVRAAQRLVASELPRAWTVDTSDLSRITDNIPGHADNVHLSWPTYQRALGARCYAAFTNKRNHEGDKSLTISRDGTQLTLKIPREYRCKLQVSTDCQTWTTVGTYIAPYVQGHDEKIQTVTVPITPSSGTRFYRLAE